jgi:hypothetical protein
MKTIVAVLACMTASTAWAQTKPIDANVVNTPSVNVANAPAVKVMRTGERIFIEGLVSLNPGSAGAESSSFYAVPAGMFLIIENVQYDTNAACFFRYIPVVILDRPIDGGVRFDHYSMAVVSPTPFTTDGGAYMSADSRQVTLNAPPRTAVRFGFSRNNNACFGQIRFQLDGRLESIG